ncbi:hypothetical protein HD553DRAFT_322523 [Filobasidium floriforme]|uniref:uncharacterized protein n=1 Tax=Filobasidium floriforme TaxID=5210 RepID=UPI001E8E27DE|nr:uncharacterized protein HD553DRAFT_322523 [Filobasidium floriforme]KAH8087988.1 hypothetical protein HD553DRAFT_322523 [Filobasidium floriforme]
MVQHKPLDRCKDVWEEDIDTGEMVKLPGLCLYTQSTGLPCKHVFDSLIRGVRVQPIKLHEIHSHWHLVHENQLVEEAQAIGHYVPRIVTRETGDLELRTRANIAPPIVNRYIPVDREALPPRAEDDPTILDPMKAVHVGKEKKKKKNAVAPSYQQSHGLAETLARIDPPAAVDTPVAKTGRAYSRHENIINQERARTSSAPATTDRAPVSCSVCGGPHNYRSPKCKQGLAIVQAEVLAGSARRAASQQSNNGRAMSSLSIERTSGTDVHERQGDLSVDMPQLDLSLNDVSYDHRRQVDVFQPLNAGICSFTIRGNPPFTSIHLYSPTLQFGTRTRTWNKWDSFSCLLFKLIFATMNDLDSDEELQVVSKADKALLNAQHQIQAQNEELAKLFRLEYLLEWPENLPRSGLKAHPTGFVSFEDWIDQYVAANNEAQRIAKGGKKGIDHSPSKKTRRQIVSKVDGAEIPYLPNDNTKPVMRLSTGAYVACLQIKVDKGGVKNDKAGWRDDQTIAEIIVDEEERAVLPIFPPVDLLMAWLRPNRSGKVNIKPINGWLDQWRGGWQVACLGCYQRVIEKNEPPSYIDENQLVVSNPGVDPDNIHRPLVHCVKYGPVFLCRKNLGSSDERTCGQCKDKKAVCHARDPRVGDIANDPDAHPMKRIDAVLETIFSQGQMTKEARQGHVLLIREQLKANLCHAARGHDGNHPFVSHKEHITGSDDEN